jgi:molybdate transport system substrate-binding protein
MSPTKGVGATGALRTLAAVLVVGAFAAAAGTAGAHPAEQRGSAQLSVFAAASLTEVFPRIDSKPKYNFAASNTLLQQLRQGAPADVFASASPRETQAAFEEGLCERPVTFAYNKLVVIVPKSNPANIRTVFDLRKPGVKVVIASQGVPVGDYTRTILRNLGISSAVLANLVSNEPDVKSVVGKITLGEGDAGFVYRTDVTPVREDVSFIRLPSWAQPPVRYQICVVTRSSNKQAARAFVRRVLGPIGRGNLSGALFGLPPKQ